VHNQRLLELEKILAELLKKDNVLLEQSGVERARQQDVERSPVEPPREQGACMACRGSFVFPYSGIKASSGALKLACR
jgi:hypothetical protein